MDKSIWIMPAIALAIGLVFAAFYLGALWLIGIALMIALGAIAGLAMRGSMARG